MKCPNCGEDMEYIEPEPEVGIVGGWSCECGADVEDDLDEDDPELTGLEDPDDEGDEW